MPSQVPPRRLLIVEDDSSIAASLLGGLERAGFAARHAGTATMAAELALSVAPDLVVLDIGLPDGDGFTLLRRWRAELPDTPVIVLTSHTDLEDRMLSLELGAVDWMPKPFWMEELVARVRLRLTRLREDHAVSWGEARLDLQARRVEVGGELVRLSPQEWSLLAWLARHPGSAVTRKKLGEVALEPGDKRGPRAVDTYVARLRRKLGPAGAAIETVWGLGYRFRVDA